MGRAIDDRIEAEVILRPSDPSKNLGQPIRAETVEQLAAPKGAMKRISDKLRKFGFAVVAEGSASISIAGPKALFEKFFKLDSDADLKTQTLDVPDDLKDEVEGIYIQDRPIYFRH